MEEDGHCINANKGLPCEGPRRNRLWENWVLIQLHHYAINSEETPEMQQQQWKFPGGATNNKFGKNDEKYWI